MEARTKYFDDSCQFFANFLSRVFQCNQANYLESKLIFLATKNGMIFAENLNTKQNTFRLLSVPIFQNPVMFA